MTCIALYIGVIVFLWHDKNSYKFILAGQVLWITIAAYVCSFLGALQVPIFGGVLLYACIGLIYDLKNRCKLSPSEPITQSFSHLLDVKSFYYNETKKEVNDPNTSASPMQPLSPTPIIESPKTKDQLNIKELQPTVFQNPHDESYSEDTDSLDSNTYFLILFSACTATIFYNHTWLFLFLSIPMVTYFVYKFYKSSGLQQIIKEKVNCIWNIITVNTNILYTYH